MDGRNHEFEEWLGGCGVGVAVLRHRVEGLEHLETSDWDVAVADLDGMGRVLRERFGRARVWLRRRYVEQWFFEWNQVDLLPSFEWHGAVYLSQERFWAGVSRGEDGLPRPRLAHDAWIAWMVGVLWGGSYKERFGGWILRALEEDGEEFRACAVEAFGEAWARELMQWVAEGKPGEAARHAAELRRALCLRAWLRGPGEFAWLWLAHWGVELRHHWRPPFPWIAVLGPDGSGKTTVIRALRERWAESRLDSFVVHWRPKDRPEGEGEPTPAVTDPHGRRVHGRLKSMAQVILLSLRWWRARWGWAWHLRAKRAVMISDRYHHDLLVDPRRYRYGGSMRWARWWLRKLPQPDLVYILVAEAEVLLARKQEVEREELLRQLAAYRALADELGERAVVVDVERALEEVVERCQVLSAE